MEFEDKHDGAVELVVDVEDGMADGVSADAVATVDAPVEAGADGESGTGPLDAFLDGISEDGQAVQADVPVDGAGSQAMASAGDEGADEAVQEEDALLAGIASERGRKRIRSMLKGHRELQAKCEQLTAVNEGFAKMIQETGMAPEELAKTLEFCRLAHGEDAAGLEMALEMLERERNALYLRLGKDAPGTDPLAGFDDLKQAVAGNSLSPQWASEVARFRRLKAQRDAEVRRSQISEQERQAYVDRVQVFQREALSLFTELRKQDPDYAVREQAVMSYLSKPGVMQGMVNRLSPDQFLYHLKAVYDTAPVGRFRPVGYRETPLSGPSMKLSRQGVSGRSGSEIMGSVLENMGL